MSSDTDLAQALRDAIDDLERVAHEDNSCCDPDVDIQRYRAVLALHDAARAQPAPSVADYFDKLRRDDNHHLGLGDVRLTLGQQEDVVQMAARAQPASVADDLNEDAAWIRAFAIPSCERQTTRSGLEAIAKKLDLLAAPRLPAKESDR